jgi:accessory gene regulator protein AgrB
MQAHLAHVQQPLEAMVRTQSLSVARIIFLVSLVVFFTLLFVGAYVWMRRPTFGQHEGHPQSGGSPVASSDATKEPGPVNS